MPTELQPQLSESTTTAQELGVNHDDELASGVFYYQVQQDLMAPHAFAYYEYLVHQDILLHQYYAWQLQLLAQQQVTDTNRDCSFTSFLHRQDDSFLTPWSRNDNEDGDYFVGEDGKQCMVLQPGSFFTNDVPYVKPETTQKGPSIPEDTN